VVVVVCRFEQADELLSLAKKLNYQHDPVSPCLRKYLQQT